MGVADFAFICFSAIAVAAGIMVVWLPNILHAAYFLIASFFGVAGLYALLEADFVAAIQVLLYIGGVVILIVFAIMLSDRSDVSAGKTRESRLPKRITSLFIGGLVLGALYLIVVVAPWKVSIPSEVATATTIYSLGNLLLTRYLLPFEVASVLLLGALIGAIVIARQK